jgi:outer membrane receptor protein involved in Fe transport
LGSHHLKAGWGLENTTNDVNRFYPGGYVLVSWDRSFTGVAGVPDRGPYGYYEVNDFQNFGSTSAKIHSLYAQDRWRIAERLTLNFGVRMETERVPSFRPDIKEDAIAYGWKDRIGPRIGLSYDLFGDGKIRMFGSWGGTLTGPNSIWHEPSSVARSGKPTIARWTRRTCFL